MQVESIYTPQEIMQMFKYKNMNSVYCLVTRGKIGHVRVGKKGKRTYTTYFRQSDIRDYYKNHKKRVTRSHEAFTEQGVKELSTRLSKVHKMRSRAKIINELSSIEKEVAKLRSIMYMLLAKDDKGSEHIMDKLNDIANRMVTISRDLLRV